VGHGLDLEHRVEPLGRHRGQPEAAEYTDCDTLANPAEMFPVSHPTVYTTSDRQPALLFISRVFPANSGSSEKL
jgi:hypothetical protein